ncbi:MAG: carboxypeptidase M32, partial [Rickettsiaceae bacterium]|nr:carboxypeptidase M32 [Rickettsiaceae bacterium]
MNNYSKLEYEIEKIQHIKNSINILNWDIAVNTPKGSIESRSREIAELSKITDERLLSPKLIELIENINLEELDEWQKANVREIR